MKSEDRSEARYGATSLPPHGRQLLFIDGHLEPWGQQLPVFSLRAVHICEISVTLAGLADVYEFPELSSAVGST